MAKEMGMDIDRRLKVRVFSGKSVEKASKKADNTALDEREKVEAVRIVQDSEQCSLIIVTTVGNRILL